MSPIIPFESLDNNTEFQNEIWIGFDKSIKRTQYDDIKSTFDSYFGDAITIPELDIPESENIYLYNTIIIISVLIAALAAINFAILYKYILEKREKYIAVFRICGCTKLNAAAIFLTECMIITIPVFIASTIIYDRMLLPLLGHYFIYMEQAYSFAVYAVICFIYIVTSIIVLIIMLALTLWGKTLTELKAGADI